MQTHYRWYRLYILVVMIMGGIGGLTGCGAESNPIIVSPAPTLTPSLSPTALPPTATLEPSPIGLGGNPTTTPLPPLAFRRDFTATSGASPTSPLGPTFTPAPATLTATPNPTQVGLTVEFFTATSAIIAPGQTITLYWQVRGAERIDIYRLNADNERDQQWRDLNLSGQLPVQANPTTENLVRFVLVATAGTAVVEQPLDIELSCSGGWFFFPQPEGCPTSEAEPSFQVQQRFERGFMIWNETRQEIFVFFTDETEPQWLRAADEYTDGLPERDDSLIPPPSMQQPIRGFGYLWRNNPELRNRIGWAIEGEVGYEGMLQASLLGDGTERIYMRALGGDIVELLPEGSAWRLIAPEAAPSPTEVPSSLQDQSQ